MNTPLVLVVEDDARSAKVLVDVLPLHGYRVRHVGSGEAAVEACREEVPAAILLDFQLPGISGSETLARVKALPGLATVPVIAMTASARLRDPQQFIAQGFAGLEAKPIDLLGLIGRIGGMVGSGTHPSPSGSAVGDDDGAK